MATAMNPVIIKRTPLVTFAVDKSRITAADICAILTDLTGFEWHAEDRHVGGNGSILFAEANGCPFQIPLSITGRGTAYLSKLGVKLGERDYAQTQLLIDDDILPIKLAEWLRRQPA